MIPLWAQGAIVLALLGGAAAGGAKLGAAHVQAKWDKQVLEDKEAAEVWRESNRLRAQASASTYETQRAEIAARAPSKESDDALRTHVCPPGQQLEFGNVPVDRSWLERLRNAGADGRAAD